MECALWGPVRAREDRQALLERMAAQFEARHHMKSARSLRRSAQEASAHAIALREVLREAAAVTLRRIVDDDDGEQEGSPGKVVHGDG